MADTRGMQMPAGEEAIMAVWRLRLCILLALCGPPLAADEFSDAIDKAVHGDMFDQADVGTAFYFGNGVPQDYKQAWIWSEIAVQNGLDDAAERRDKAAAKLSPEELEKAGAEATALLKSINGQ
jgi:TPR repeat protein